MQSEIYIIHIKNGASLSMMETLDMLKQKALWMQVRQNKNILLQYLFIEKHYLDDNFQEGMGAVAGHIESLENVFNFTVPYISWFIYIFFLLLTIFLYLAPLRLLVLVWVVNRFRKGLLKNTSDGNEVINFLSRVPDDEELVSNKII